MFQRFASALFGDDVEEVSRGGRPGDGKVEETEEEDEDWILVNYLTEAGSSQCNDTHSGSTIIQDEDEEVEAEEDEEDDELVMIPSPMGIPPVRYASCTSLNSTADTETDGGPDEDEEDEESGFLRVDTRSLQESWFLTPPPCFTGRSTFPIVLEPSPLENLLIEHPSMSVYTHHSIPRLNLDPLPPSSHEPELNFSSDEMTASLTASSGKEKARRTPDGSRHRPEAAVSQRRSSLHSSCYAAALSTQAGLVQQRPGNPTQRTQPMSRKALRRLNLLRPPKANTMHLHQPSQRHLNF
ncbi:tumor protein p53-inducible nuclear protein 1 [Pelmatolapia mariae]|uniref:tumor protein p53-inducible nuclear protein 1 n=1 Tax=Pelmatolapia mariae TaxID=158779 RepID=UPI002FE59D52